MVLMNATAMGDQAGARQDENVGREMLTVAHVLLSSERLANEEELVVSSCIEFLSSSPANTSEIHKGLNLIWPGAGLTLPRVQRALAYAKDSGILAEQVTNGASEWSLTKLGTQEIAATNTWYSDAMARLAGQIQERATQDFGGVTSEQADLWAATLLKILTGSIAADPQTYTGAIQKAANGSVRPASMNGEQMRSDLGKLDSPEGTKEFLAGCLVAAIDESDPFGNEIVSYVATSCILHSIVAGRSRSSAQEALGPLTGQRIVLDTTVLVAYLGPHDTAAHLSTVIRLSNEAGMEVIAPEHVIEELEDVISRVEDKYIPGLLESLHGGVGSRIYANSVNEQVLELFLDAVEEKRYKSWSEFAKRARSIRSELGALGIVVREHGNKNRSRVDDCYAQLTSIVEASSSGRGAKQIQRDAESMELVWRARRRNPKKSAWPGAWLVTSDRKISRAYSTIEPKDREPLVLNPSQWATLITNTAQPPEVRELIGAAASFLRQEAVLKIAVKYPPEIAFDLARTLDHVSASETDIRVAQLTLSDLLDSADENNLRTRDAISEFVANKRANRQAIAANVQREAYETERKRMNATTARTTTHLNEAQLARKDAERIAFESQKQHDDLILTNERLVREKQEYVALGTRRAVRTGVIVFAVVAAALLLALGVWLFAVGTLIGLVVFLKQSEDWVRDKKIGPGRLFFALIPELLGVIGLLVDLM